MTSAIFCDINNATASGVADALCSDVREHSEKYATRTLNILQLNINGTQRKIDELSCLLYDNNIHIACLQETKLNKNLNLKIKGYTELRKDRTKSTGGGLAFLIKTPTIKYTEISSSCNSPTNSETEAHAIKLDLPGRTVTIVNAYHPDRSEIDTDIIKDLCSSPSDIKIILGDFNAKSPSWGSPHLDKKGAQIEDLLCDLNLSTLNSGEHTYISKSNGTASALDITAVDLSCLDIAKWRVVKCAISDHFPLITSLNLNVDSPPQNMRSWNFRKANWNRFTECLETYCTEMTTSKNLEDLIQKFNSGVQKAAKASIPRGKRKNNWVPYWRDHNIDNLIQERDTASRELEKYNCEENRRKLIDTSRRVEDEIAACKREKWVDLCSKLDPRKDHQHWRVINVLNNRCNQQHNGPTSNVVTSGGYTSKTDKQAANLLAQHYEQASRLSFGKEDRVQRRIYKQALKQSKSYNHKDVFSNAITLEELDSAINSLDPKKSPGIDLIFGSMIKHFGALAKSILLQIFNLSWTSGKLPTVWKTSVIVPILKPGKDAASCKNYRPISLTSTLCKVMEKIIHSRIMNWLMKRNILHFYQTAYRAQHSTVDQLFYLVQSIIDGLQEKPHKKTTAVFLDLSAAFDRVWRQKLIEILHSSGISGNILLWINDFLRDRRFAVRVNGKFSRTHRSWAGIPQGSVLSPLLFLLYMNTIHDHIVKDAKIACYADDIAIWHSHTDITTSEIILNENLSHIEDWAKQLKLLINPEKTKYCVFSTDRRNRATFLPELKINNSIIDKISYPKYLGLTLDAELRFTKHIENTSLKALKKLNVLRKLCGSTWGSTPKTLLNTYTALIRPILEYAAPIWAPSASTLTEKIDSVQYRASKIIIGAVSSTNNITAEKECGLPSLKNRRKLATINFTNKIRSCNEHHVSNITFRSWTAKNRLKRSSTLQFDDGIRNEINMKHTSLDIIREPCFPVKPPPFVKIILDLLEPCTKLEHKDTLKRKGMDTILGLLRPHLVTAYTDGSSDSECNRGGSGVFLQYPDNTTSRHRVSAGLIASNFTCELIAIRTALDIYLTWTNIANSDGIIVFSDCRSALEAIKEGKIRLTQDIISLLFYIGEIGKSCTLQWIPAHVDIEGNEVADSLAKEARTLRPATSSTTVFDANAVAKQKICSNSRKKFSLPELNYSREITTAIARLRTKHFKGMKILPDGSRTYVECKHCPGTQLDPKHIFNCPSIVGALFKIDINCGMNSLYTDRAKNIATAVIHAFGNI